MDWHAWLSASRLDPALVYEYALVFARNELEADDVAYLDHELLHSMGVSVAKHRLEILKLAWRDRGRRRPSFSRSTNKPRLLERVARYVRSLVRREEDSSTAALVLVPIPSQQEQQPADKQRRAKALRRARSEPKGSTPARQAIGGRAAAAVHAIRGDLDYCVCDGEEMVRWDTLFQDLKPN